VPKESLRTATFEELAVPLFGQLYNFAHWLTQERSEAEDLVQETYAKALKGFASFEPGTNFRAWMYRILRNTFLTSRSGLKSTVPLEEDSEDPAIPSVSETPESLLIEQLNQEALQQAIAELPIHFRTIVLMADVEEMSYQEMAQVLSIPAGTVMSRLARARKALRESLRKKLGVRSHAL
jgi:RNA polymerase sigma-70 factor (ECF subfamily)